MTEEILKQLAEDPVPVLNRGYRAKERIEARRERIESWRQIAESITANPENASSGGGYPTSKVENCVVNIMALEEEIKDEISEILSFEREAGEMIRELVEDPNYKAILELRYLSYLRWEEIAVRLGYTFRWTQELHRRAVDAMREAASFKKAR